MELPNVSNEIREYFASRIKRSPAYSIWASRIGDPCERYLYHSVVDWEQAKPIEPRVQGLFMLGSHLEALAAKFLEKTGWKVVPQLDTYVWKEKHISGAADRFISRGEIQKIPVEIKFLMNLDVSTWQEMIDADQRWVRRYPAQLLTYMLLRGTMLGLFLNCGKLDADPTHIWFDLENDVDLLNYAESVLQKAERVWKAIEAKTPCPRIDPGEGICLRCDFFLPCSPPVYFGETANILDNSRLVKILDRMEEIREPNSEFERLAKEKKEVLEGISNAIAGPYIIEGKKVRRKGFTVEESTYWRHDIKKVDLSEKKDVF
jgi:hypothetical protein